MIKICVILTAFTFVNFLVLLPRERTLNVLSDHLVIKTILFKNNSLRESRLKIHGSDNTTDLQPISLETSNYVGLSRQVHREGDNHQFGPLTKDNHSNRRIRISIDNTPVQSVNLKQGEIVKEEGKSSKIQLWQETGKSVNGLKVYEIPVINTGTKSKLWEQKSTSVSSNLSGRKGSLVNKTDLYNTLSRLPQDVPCVTIGVYCNIRKGRWQGNHFCPATNCTVKVVQSDNYTHLRDADAFYVPQSSLSHVNLQKLNTYRPHDQIWIFNAFESPVHTFTAGGRWAEQGFNWTLTYRTDSTFPSPYGRYIPGTPMVPANDTTNWAENKTKFAAWIGSNCHNTQWPRLSYVRKLQALIPLDTFGSCGTKTCPKSLKCGEILRQYKFFFALENSACKDYITEKFWAAPFRNNLIPVVYGPTREDYEKVAPPKSFIHVQDFKTMAELSHYLKILDENDDLFNEYFEWKKQGSVEMNLIGNYYISKNIMCPIGEKILSMRRERIVEKNTVDMTAWWVKSCRVGSMP